MFPLCNVKGQLIRGCNLWVALGLLVRENSIKPTPDGRAKTHPPLRLLLTSPLQTSSPTLISFTHHEVHRSYPSRPWSCSPGCCSSCRCYQSRRTRGGFEEGTYSGRPSQHPPEQQGCKYPVTIRHLISPLTVGFGLVVVRLQCWGWYHQECRRKSHRRQRRQLPRALRERDGPGCWSVGVSLTSSFFSSISFLTYPIGRAE